MFGLADLIYKFFVFSFSSSVKRKLCEKSGKFTGEEEEVWGSRIFNFYSV